MSATLTTADAAPISLDESRDLIRLEKIVGEGLQTVFEVGEALTEIRDRKLYRIEHTTFADYCKVKWGMSDRRARQLMDAAAVVFDIGKSGTTVPISERQVRPLTALPKEERAEVWSQAVAAAPNGQPTTREVERVALQRCHVAPAREKNEPLPRALGGSEIAEFQRMEGKLHSRLQTLIEAFPLAYRDPVLAIISAWVAEEIAAHAAVRAREEASL